MKINKFERDKKYKFDIILYKSYYIKEIKKAKYNKNYKKFRILENAYNEGLETFAKELSLGKYTFPVIKYNNKYIGIYTCQSNKVNYQILPEWCRIVE